MVLVVVVGDTTCTVEMSIVLIVVTVVLAVSGVTAATGVWLSNSSHLSCTSTSAFATLPTTAADERGVTSTEGTTEAVVLGVRVRAVVVGEKSQLCVRGKKKKRRRRL